jgi:NAD(P)-dependent dehydrogenase (short-subunit alcohol dehydrogenase family)
VKQVTDEFGGIDNLLNNAGINLKKDFLEVSDEEFQRILHTNVTAIFSLSGEVVKEMVKKGSGTIINISSMASQYGIPKMIANTASKSAIEGRKQKVMSRTPMGKLGEPADFGDTALFLPSDGARYITSVILPVDGGNSIGF